MARPPETVYTSDLHLGHPKVAEIRGFPSVEAHDACILDNIAAVVRRPVDRLVVLGDVTGSGSRSVLIPALLALSKIPGEKHLIAGNHDSVHPMARPRLSEFTDYALAFATVASAGRRKIAGTNVLLSHFPYTRDRGETRYPQWRLPNLGEWLLHGHTHGTERVTYAAPIFQWETVSREIHVGLDAWDLAPVHTDTIAALIKEHTP